MPQLRSAGGVADKAALAGEVADLQANHFAGETDVKGRTRGVKVCPPHVVTLKAQSCYA
jgi:hypothetical protein